MSSMHIIIPLLAIILPMTACSASTQSATPKRDRNWEIHTLDLTRGDFTNLTQDPADDQTL